MTRKRPVGSWIVLALFAVWTLFPIYWLTATSFKAPNEVSSIPPVWIPKLDISAYTTALSDPAIQASLLNSLLVAVGATAISLLCGVLAGYALGNLTCKRAENYEFWVLTSRMAPPVAAPGRRRSRSTSSWASSRWISGSSPPPRAPCWSRRRWSSCSSNGSSSPGSRWAR